VKFKDADLIGVPFRVNIGRKLASGVIEVVTRATRARADVKIGEGPRYIREASAPRA